MNKNWLWLGGAFWVIAGGVVWWQFESIPLALWAGIPFLWTGIVGATGSDITAAFSVVLSILILGVVIFVPVLFQDVLLNFLPDLPVDGILDEVLNSGTQILLLSVSSLLLVSSMISWALSQLSSL